MCEKLVDDLQRLKQHQHQHQPPKSTFEASRSPTPDMLLDGDAGDSATRSLPELDLDAIRANQSTALPAIGIAEQVRADFLLLGWGSTVSGLVGRDCRLRCSRLAWPTMKSRS
jgi:hypothetical protein